RQRKALVGPLRLHLEAEWTRGALEALFHQRRGLLPRRLQGELYGGRRAHRDDAEDGANPVQRPAGDRLRLAEVHHDAPVLVADRGTRPASQRPADILDQAPFERRPVLSLEPDLAVPYQDDGRHGGIPSSEKVSGATASCAARPLRPWWPRRRTRSRLRWSASTG